MVQSRYSRLGTIGRFTGPAAADIAPTRTKTGEAVTGFQIAGGPYSRNATVRIEDQQRGSSAGGNVDFSRLDFGHERVGGVNLSGIKATDFLFSQEQQREVAGIRKSASARGLFGGAVTQTATGRAQEFLSANQAQGFQNVVQSGMDVFGRAGRAVRGLEAQVEGLTRMGELGQVYQVASAGEKNLRQFADPLFEALVGFGHEKALSAGLALSQGERGRVDISSFGLSGEEENIARAVHQFLNPTLTSGQHRRIDSSRANRGQRHGARVMGVAENRVQAGQSLISTITRPRRQLQGAVQELRAAGMSAAALLGSGQALSAADLQAGLPSYFR